MKCPNCETDNPDGAKFCFNLRKQTDPGRPELFDREPLAGQLLLQLRARSGKEPDPNDCGRFLRTAGRPAAGPA